MGDIRFDELKIPFVCAATDLQTGERVVFREGPVVPAARASATIPGLFSPVVFRQRYLVDGGLVSNLPTDLVRSIGADIVVASDVSSDYANVEPGSVLSTITQAVYIQGQQINRENRRLADVIVTPDLRDISPMDLTRSAECIDAGSRAARQGALDRQTALDRSLLAANLDIEEGRRMRRKPLLMLFMLSACLRAVAAPVPFETTDAPASIGH